MKNKIHERVKTSRRPNGAPYRQILEADIDVLAHQLNVSRKEIQIIALKEEIIPERYSRNFATLTTSQQIRLLESTVAVIGLGGLGGTVTEILSRIGVGNLILVDGDQFEESNLNRQLLCSTENLGKHKAEVAGERVSAINPAVETKSICEFFTEANAHRILGEADVVVDCLDSISTRLELERSCQKGKIPLVSAAIAGSDGQATTILPGSKTLHTLYPRQTISQERGGEKERGTLGYTAFFMAAVECAETVSLICSASPSLDRQILFAELQDTSFTKISLP